MEMGMDTQTASQVTQETQDLREEPKEETRGIEPGNDVDEHQLYSEVNALVTKHGEHVLNFGMKPLDALKAIHSALTTMDKKLNG